jgi:predicted Fe-Mo cluster-binding NifX family protein
MKVAIPTENGIVFPHFGHCRVFTIIEVDTDTKEFRNVESLTPPPHEQGVIPSWLSQLGCTHIIAGGMGQRAVVLFEQNGIQVISGVPAVKAEDAVRAFLNGGLQTDANPCQDPSFRRNNPTKGQCGSGHHDCE